MRSSSRRTGSPCRSSTSASRYSATVRSVPENPAASRPGSGCPASHSAASRSPAAQPSVRSTSGAGSGRSTPAAANSSRASATVNRRSGSRISASPPSSRSRCRPSRTSCRVASTNRSSGGARMISSSSCRSASGPSSCTSSTTSHNRSSSGARSVSSRSVITHPSRSGAAVSSPDQRRPRARLPQRGQHRQPEPLRIPLAAPGRHPRRAARHTRPADPGPQQHRLAAARRRRHHAHPGRAPAARTAGDGTRHLPHQDQRRRPQPRPLRQQTPWSRSSHHASPRGPLAMSRSPVTCAVPQTRMRARRAALSLALVLDHRLNDPRHQRVRHAANPANNRICASTTLDDSPLIAAPGRLRARSLRVPQAAGQVMRGTVFLAPGCPSRGPRRAALSGRRFAMASPA